MLWIRVAFAIDSTMTRARAMLLLSQNYAAARATPTCALQDRQEVNPTGVMLRINDPSVASMTALVLVIRSARFFVASCGVRSRPRTPVVITDARCDGVSRTTQRSRPSSFSCASTEREFGRLRTWIARARDFPRIQVAQSAHAPSNTCGTRHHRFAELLDLFRAQLHAVAGRAHGPVLRMAIAEDRRRDAPHAATQLLSLDGVTELPRRGDLRRQFVERGDRVLRLRLVGPVAHD